MTGGGWYVWRVLKKTSLYLEPAVDRGLALIAERTGVTKAEAIRRILAQAVAEQAPRPRITAIGVGRGPGDVVERWEEYMDGFGE